MSQYSYSFTVFTPTYNRAHTLSRVYDSLVAQTFRDFEWLIVDDGSEDQTDELVKKWQSEATFPIRYFWQENGGRYRTINRGVEEARGELFLILDSDDACVPTALERFKSHWDSIPDDEREGFSGVSSLVKSPQGEVVGTEFPQSPYDSHPLEIRNAGVVGEKWGFHRTEVLKRYPFPVIDGEKFTVDSLIWNRIGLRYKTRFVNEALRIYYDTPDSMSSSPLLRIRNPIGSRSYYREFVNLDYPHSWRLRLRHHANYSRFSFHAGVGLRRQLSEIDNGLLWLATLPMGFALYVRDRRLLASAR